MLTTEQFHKLLEKGPLLLDGATGSNLQKAGMPRGCCTEEWILANPDILVALQRAYRKAGIDQHVLTLLYIDTLTDDQISIFS